MVTSEARMAKRCHHPRKRRPGGPKRTSGDGVWAAPNRGRLPVEIISWWMPAGVFGARPAVYQTVLPPLTAIVWPVTKEASSLARYVAAQPTSSGLPQRPIGTVAR